MAGNGHWQADTSSVDQDGLLPVVKFLQSALAMKAKGDGHHYQHLVAQLLTRDDPETLWRLYLGLSQCVTIISQQPEEYKELIDAVFRFDWRASDKIVQSFGGLLSHLVSANSTCMVPAMHMLVRNLVLTLRDLDGEGNVDPMALTRQHHVHAALQASLALVPSGRSKLFGVLKQNYPHRRLRAEVLSDYALHALRVVQYAPLIEESVLRLIIEKSLEIDVEIKIMDTGEAVVDDEDDECDALFTMDDVLDGTAADTKKQNTEEVDEMAEKLDGVMLVVFTYLDQRLTAHASLPSEKILDTPLVYGASTAEDEGAVEGGRVGADTSSGGSSGSSSKGRRSSTGGLQGMEPVARLLKSLLLVFEESILPTHRSKFVQFVVFFASGRAHGLGYALTSKLIEGLRDDMKPKLTRQSSVAYLASFLARGSFVDASLVSSAVRALLDWAARYLDEHVDGLAAATPQAVRASTLTGAGTPGSKAAFQTPVASRIRARPQSWHGSDPPPGSANAGGAMQAPMSTMSARSVAGGSGSGSVSGSSSSKGRAADHMLFYSVCQATFYVTCFRGDELAAMEGFGDQAAIWQRVLTCPLFPLRRCLDTVRREFARLCCGLMDQYLDPDLLEHLAGISEERPQVSQTITVGSSFSCSTPRSASSTSLSSSMWTPSRVTKAGGLGRGSNPLDSFFPFDPYLLRRSHAYVAGMYNSWKVQDGNASRRHRYRRRKTRPSSTRTPASGRPRRGSSADAEDSGASSVSSDSSSSDDDDDDSSDGDDSDAMDASSLSFRDGASGGGMLLAARSRRRRAEKKAEKKMMKDTQKRLARRGNKSRRGGEGSEASSSEEDDDEEPRRMTRKMADTYITESMSVTPGSSVACGSLMGRSLGQAMSSSFADDGLVWGAAAAAAGGVAGTPDDAFFHENVSPCVSPPLASSAIGVAGRSQPLDIGARSKRALF